MASAAEDTSAYQDNPYGMTDPTALYQHLMTDPGMGEPGTAAGGMARNALAAGFNPAMQHAQSVQANMQKILADVGDMKDGEDPLDYQMRQARAVGSRMYSVDPNVSIRADQQMIRLQNAKAQMANLNSEIQYRQAETKKSSIAAAQAAADPLVMVQQGKDGYGLPTYSQVGNPVTMFDEKGNVRDGWSNDATKERASNPGAQQMRQSEYLALVAKTNEGKNIAMLQAAQLRAQMQLYQVGQLGTPDQQQALDSQAQDIVQRHAPMPPQPPIGARNPVAMATWSALKNKVDAQQEALTPGQKFDTSDYGVNVKQENSWNHGPDSDTVRRIGVAESHLQDLEYYQKALKQYGPDSPITNSISLRIQKWLGGVGPVEYDTANRRVAGEITSAVIGRTATLEDRKSAEQDTAAKLSKAQINGSYDALHTMLYDQANGLRSQYLGGFRGMSDQEKAQRWNAKLSAEGRTMMADIDAKKGLNAVGDPISGNTADVKATAAAKAGASAAPEARIVVHDAKGNRFSLPASQEAEALKQGYTKE